MKTKRSIYFLAAGLLAVMASTAQEAPHPAKRAVQAGKVVSEIKGPGAIQFLSMDTLRVTPTHVAGLCSTGRRKRCKEGYTSYIIADGDCVSLECTVGNATIELKHLDNILMFDRHGKIDLVSISGEKEIRLTDIKTVSITVDPY